jgi:hypothetical protein
MRFKEIAEGLRDPKDNPCWKGYYPVGTKKKNGRTVPNCVPKESVDEASKDDPAGELNPFTKFALKKIRAKHPQAKSEFDALIADLNSGQQQDRRDIGRLDQENDQEEADIERLDIENDSDETRLDRLEQELAAIKRLIK